MTDTPASLDALGIKPVAWRYDHMGMERRHVTISRDYDPNYVTGSLGYTETPLYSATDLAPLIAKARRVEELEAALRKIAAECCVPVGADKQMYARWRQLAADRVDIARAALKENTDG